MCCRGVPASSTTIPVQADGFARGAAPVLARRGGTARVNLQLRLAYVQTDVQVGADPTDDDGNQGAGTTVLGRKEIERLPDDPDDLLRELQILASSSGGDPTATTIAVDGFQTSSALPPKGSIASIRISPDDSVASEYQWHRGRVEITTKPGADKFHGAPLFTNRNSIQFRPTLEERA